MAKDVILSGMRPTGRLHIGHLSVLENWVRLQEEYDCYYTIVDWHALTTSFQETESIKDNIKEMLVDWLAAGLDPEKSTIFVQSHVPQHAELHLMFSMITPLSWLERVPTYKDQVQQLGKMGKDINTYGFLGYPLLQAADILVYRADAVPVGEDQLPHLELCREIARRFNYMYDRQVFPEPQALLSKVKLLPGVDGRKMSKSYLNVISLAAEQEEIKKQVNAMVTDPNRIRKTDPGNPDVCVVDKYHGIYAAAEHEDIREQCRKGAIGCVQCKKRLAQALEEQQAPLRERRNKILNNRSYLEDVLAEGAKAAREAAEKTMEQVREAVGI
ncbi:tryptophanyl-tRNA synthetase [Desulfohalotomaculum tongense]|uniref:tryptophan--tRNA ligase n=1 Tax=Desulforadius tongensis TaxID=1216062 RepID=UPI001958CB00|nr:tryptophan--tRNA ligase [Desulforadius tongensis]MBM7854683.1 tryptophanyl-tRNA synthetase [Desulforadius tongensis]